MGAALTYARRYALFALVGIAGEDDLDAPDLLKEPPPAVATEASQAAQNGRKPTDGSIHRPRQPKPLLAIEPSATLRDQLIDEIQKLKDPDDLASWEHRRLPDKNTLIADDARVVEAAYQELLIQDAQPEYVAALDQPTAKLAFPQLKAGCKRNKAHLAFVAAQACLICKRSPCDAHHLKFAQPRSLGRKVSDEFTVPLCRKHHQDLHRHATKLPGGTMCRLRRSR
jgi:ERF superfamily